MFSMTKARSGIKTALTGAILATSFLITAAQSQTFPPFPEPAVGPFPDTENMRLLSQLLPAEIGAVTPRGGVLLNDIWGWTSPAGEEYALVGTGDGMSIVRVTDPENPAFIGLMPTPSTFNNLWGDVAVYNANLHMDDDDDDKDVKKRPKDWFAGYAYFTTEADGTGISILDLSQLDHYGPAPHDGFQIPATKVFEEGGYNSAHNIYVHQETGFAYVVGAELTGSPTACDGQPYHPSRFNTLILDLKNDPLNPEIVACLADHGEHDIYVVNYRGPDKDYKNREIAFVFDGRDKDAATRRGMRQDDTPGELGGGTTEIWDVTDKQDIKVIASFTVPGICFSHQGWTSSNRHEFLLINDEIDELRDAEPDDGTGLFRTNFCDTDLPGGTLSTPGMYVMNIRDLDNPVFQELYSLDNAVGGENDHNFVRRGNKLYWAVYNTGTRVIKMKNKKGQLKLEEIGRLDTEPRSPPVFFGQWGIFPFPHSKTIVASDINNGLMVMRLEKGATGSSEADLRVSGARGLSPAATLSKEDKAAAREAYIEHIKSRIR